MKYLREWIFVTFVAFVMIGALTFTYHFGVQAHDDRQQAQQSQISFVQKEQAIQNDQTQSIMEAVHSSCEGNVRDWETFQRVIEAATNPPSQAGRALTPEQLAALSAYRQGLIDSVGPKPSC